MRTRPCKGRREEGDEEGKGGRKGKGRGGGPRERMMLATGLRSK